MKISTTRNIAKLSACLGLGYMIVSLCIAVGERGNPKNVVTWWDVIQILASVIVIYVWGYSLGRSKYQEDAERNAELREYLQMMQNTGPTLITPRVTRPKVAPKKTTRKKIQ
jgi:hypothetical protein